MNEVLVMIENLGCWWRWNNNYVRWLWREGLVAMTCAVLPWQLVWLSKRLYGLWVVSCAFVSIYSKS